jgi:hypothetical protein
VLQRDHDIRVRSADVELVAFRVLHPDRVVVEPSSLNAPVMVAPREASRLASLEMKGRPTQAR